MDYNPYGFEEIFRAFGYETRNDSENDGENMSDHHFQNEKWTNVGYGSSEDGNNENLNGARQWNEFTGFDFNCSDIPYGFQ